MEKIVSLGFHTVLFSSGLLCLLCSLARCDVEALQFTLKDSRVVGDPSVQLPGISKRIVRCVAIALLLSRWQGASTRCVPEHNNRSLLSRKKRARLLPDTAVGSSRWTVKSIRRMPFLCGPPGSQRRRPPFSWRLSGGGEASGRAAVRAGRARGNPSRGAPASESFAYRCVMSHGWTCKTVEYVAPYCCICYPRV